MIVYYERGPSWFGQSESSHRNKAFVRCSGHTTPIQACRMWNPRTKLHPICVTPSPFRLAADKQQSTADLSQHANPRLRILMWVISQSAQSAVSQTPSDNWNASRLDFWEREESRNLIEHEVDFDSFQARHSEMTRHVEKIAQDTPLIN